MSENPTKQLRDRIRASVGPTIAGLGYELAAVEIGSIPGSMVLRVYIDSPAGIGVEDCTAVSRAVSDLLDVEDPIQSEYALEVSSPGMDRLVERPQDFLRFVGLKARLKMAPGNSRKRYTGVLAGYEDDTVLLSVGAEVIRLPHAEIDQVRLELELEEFERLGTQSQEAVGGTP